MIVSFFCCFLRKGGYHSNNSMYYLSNKVIILRSIAHSGPKGTLIQSEKLVVSLKRFTL